MATKKPAYRTIQDPQQRTYTASGNQVEDVLAMRINENGEEEFYVDHKENVYEKIQAFAEDVKIENIIAKVMATGDETILNKVKGEYADISTLPNNLLEAQRQIKDAENIFNELPLNIREKYNYNFNQYLKDFGTKEWAINMGLIKEEIKEEPKEEKGESE